MDRACSVERASDATGYSPERVAVRLAAEVAHGEQADAAAARYCAQRGEPSAVRLVVVLPKKAVPWLPPKKAPMTKAAAVVVDLAGVAHLSSYWHSEVVVQREAAYEPVGARPCQTVAKRAYCPALHFAAGSAFGCDPAEGERQRLGGAARASWEAVFDGAPLARWFQVDRRQQVAAAVVAAASDQALCPRAPKPALAPVAMAAGAYPEMAAAQPVPKTAVLVERHWSAVRCPRRSRQAFASQAVLLFLPLSGLS